MKYRLVALDLDGTLLDSTLQIRHDTLEALRRVRRLGAQVMIVTGRHHTAVRFYWQQLETALPAICCNGAYSVDFADGARPNGEPLTPAESLRLLAVVRAYDVHATVYTDDAMVYEHDAPHLAGMRQWGERLPEDVRPRIVPVDSFDRLIAQGNRVWKFLIASQDEALLATFAAAAQEHGFHGVASSNKRLDVSLAGISKGKCLAEFIAHRSIAPEEVIAFGDQNNDREMLQLAGLGVAMGNSHAGVRAAADWVTGGNDQNGIASALERFVPNCC